MVEAIERGIDAESATRRALALQEELKRIRLDIPAAPLPPLPNEATIRATLARAVQSVEMRRDVKRTLREEGWPDFWRMVMAESTQASHSEE